MREGNANQQEPEPSTQSAWNKPKNWERSVVSRKIQLTAPAGSQPLQEPWLLNVLPARAVYQLDENNIGPSLVVSFAHSATGLDHGQIQGEVAWMIIQYMSTIPGINPQELTFERWEPAIGVLSTWTMEGPRTTKILVRVRPGANHALVIEALHGKYFSWDHDETQALWPQYGYCVCKGCQQYRRDKTATVAMDASTVPAQTTSRVTCLAFVLLPEGLSKLASGSKPLRRRR